MTSGREENIIPAKHPRARQFSQQMAAHLFAIGIYRPDSGALPQITYTQRRIGDLSICLTTNKLSAKAVFFILLSRF